MSNQVQVSNDAGLARLFETAADYNLFEHVVRTYNEGNIINLSTIFNDYPYSSDYCYDYQNPDPDTLYAVNQRDMQRIMEFRLSFWEGVRGFIPEEDHDRIESMIINQIEEEDLFWVIKECSGNVQLIADFIKKHNYGPSGQGGNVFMTVNEA